MTTERYEKIIEMNRGPVAHYRSMRRRVLLLALGLVVIATGCASVPKRKPLPEGLTGIARIPGIPKARIWGDEPPPYAEAWFNSTRAELEAQYPALIRSQHNYLAISGGGQKGAFGAGLLVGWTAAGNRPEFSMVTGISTGALTAPFAFLGPTYDAQLKEVYTTYSTKDFVKKRNILTAITGDAAANMEPLKALMPKYINQQMLESIAAEHRKGRRLLVGTTNLDAGRPVIWNIGYIAVSGHPKALELVQKVLLASASIPAAFPPVYIEVEAHGRRYDEIHVDGGAASQVFLYPVGIDWRRVVEKLEVKGTPGVYVIRNSRLEPEWKTVEPKLASIAGRSISSLIRTQGIGDMYRIYLGAERDGLDYNLAYITDDFDQKSKEAFDPEYMDKLFDLGYRLAKSGYPWDRVPPGFESP